MRIVWSIAGCICCLFAIWALYLPWHEWVDTQWNLCWMSDCDGIQTVSEGGRLVDTGAAHAGNMPAVLLGAAAVVSLFGGAVRRRWSRFVGIASVVLEVVAFAWVAQSMIFEHAAAQHLEDRFGVVLWVVAGLGAVAMSALLIVYGPRPPWDP